MKSCEMVLKSYKNLENHRKSYEIMGCCVEILEIRNHRKSCKIIENHTKSFEVILKS